MNKELPLPPNVGDPPLRPRRGRTRQRAFTRAELLASLVAISLLALVLLPALAAEKQDSGRAVCFNNLKRIGQAVHAWAGDHDQQFSWRTPTVEGSFPREGQSRPPGTWYDYFLLSNQLATPKILACPSDTTVKPAPNFHEFLLSGYREKSISYPIHVDGAMEVATTTLGSDHNFQRYLHSYGGYCSAGSSSLASVEENSYGVTWTNAVHGKFGHVLMTGGSVEFSSSPRLTELLFSSGITDRGRLHFLW